MLLCSCGKTNQTYVAPKGVPNYSRFSETNQMRISGWIAPYHENIDDSGNKNLISQESYNYLHDCGFNAIYTMYEFSYSHEKAILDSLEYAKNSNIKYYAKSAKIFAWEETVSTFTPGYFNTDSLMKKYKNHDAFAGHLVCDEPNVKYFNSLKARKDFYETEFPGKEFYINLLPSYASKDQLGVSTYEEYINQYINIINPRVLSFDHYSLSNVGGLPNCKPDALYNRETVAYLASQKQIPYMNFTLVSSSSAEKRRMMQEADLRWQVMCDLAYGTSGIQYFCVFPVIEGDFKNALFDEDGKPTIFYNYAKNINNMCLYMDEAFMSFQWVGTITKKGDLYEPDVGIPAFDYCKHSITSHDALYTVKSDYNTLVGCFNSKVDNYRGYMITNFEDPALDITDNVELTFTGADHVLIYHGTTKNTMPLNNGKLTLNLNPGDGVFAIPYNQ